MADPSDSFILAQQAITKAVKHLNLSNDKERRAFIEDCRFAAAMLIQAANLAEKPRAVPTDSRDRPDAA